MKKLKAYKVFNPDWICGNYDYKTNKGSAIGSIHKTKKRAFNILYNLEMPIWVPENIMTNQEKKEHPKYSIQEGYLKSISYKEAWNNLWNNLDENYKKEIKSLPNFNDKIFEDITGIKC